MRIVLGMYSYASFHAACMDSCISETMCYIGIAKNFFVVYQHLCPLEEISAHIMPFIKSPLINSNCLLLVLSYQHLLQNVNSVGLKASWVFSVSWCQPLLCGVSNPVDFNRCDMQTYVVSFLYSKPSCPYFHKMHHH